MEPIPVNIPRIQGREKELLIECIDTGWISSEGPFVREFEKRMAERFGRKHAIAVSNGTGALDCALKSLQLEPGDEVILPTFTIISCATAILNAGATPVPVDMDPDTWNMTAEHVRERITPKTKAILAVHIYGLPVEMEPLCDLAQEHGLHSSKMPQKPSDRPATAVPAAASARPAPLVFTPTSTSPPAKEA